MAGHDKPRRKNDPKAIAAVRNASRNYEGYFVCEYCFRWWASIDVHHIKTKGSGGDDDPENLIALCPLLAERSCHSLAHQERISKEELYEIAKNRNKKMFTEKHGGDT